ncbi:MAG: hypothetical protein II590_00975 [Clostridia bacterium]|nr:hypothetical protein [Clostridia bacterium]
MKCAYCGKNNKKGALVCKRCGIALPVPPPDHEHEHDEGARDIPPEAAENAAAPAGEANEGKKPDEGKKRFPLAAAIALCSAFIAVLVIFAPMLAGGSRFILPAKNAYSRSGDGALFFGGDVVPPFDSAPACSEISTNGSVACILDISHTLLISTEGKTRVAAKEVFSYVLSAGGDAVVYRDNNGLLWRAETKDEIAAPVCLCSSAVDEAYAVSPNGGTVLYSADGKLILWNGSTKELCEGKTAVSVSNGGAYIYAYSPAENALYSINKRGRETFLRANLYGYIYLNFDHDEIAFTTMSGPGIFITMCSLRGREPIEVLNSDSAVYPVVPVTGVLKLETPDDMRNFSEVVSGEAAPVRTVYTCPMKHFEGRYFHGAGLVKFSAKGSEQVDPVYCPDAVSSANGKTVVYKNDGKLRKYTSGAEASEILAENVSFFRASSNCGTVWYLDGAGALHCLNGASDTLISPAVNDAFAITPNGREAVFCIAGSLFSNKGGKAKATTAYDVKNAIIVFADSNGFYMLTEKGWTKAPKDGQKIDLTK